MPFCDHDAVECSKQQHELILPVAKCGDPLDADDTKHENRGKRDREIMLMALLQKMMFDKEDNDLLEYGIFHLNLEGN